MFDSKFYSVMILLMIAAVVFQALEMNEYNMFAQLLGK